MLKIAFIIADDMEYQPLLDKNDELGISEFKSPFNDDCHVFTLDGGGKSAEVLSVCCGVGKENAAAAAAYAVTYGADYIINFGLSGAISGVGVDDVVIGGGYRLTDFDLTAFGNEAGVVPGMPPVFSADERLLGIFKELLPGSVVGTLGTGDVFVNDGSVKNRLKTDFEITACDMESAAIALVAHKANKPFISLRLISDDADDHATETYRENNDMAKPVLVEIALKGVMKLLSE